MSSIKHTEILVNVGTRETRVALLENSLLQEIYVERQSNQGFFGNIYKGKIERVLPGMDAAFVDIGLEKNAFLHIKNIAEASGFYRSEHQDQEASLAQAKPKIKDFVKQGDELLVQVIKDPIGNKGARLSTEISIPSRYVVYIPKSEDIGISIRIEDENTRQELKDKVAHFSTNLPGGYIVRTAIENADDWALNADIQYLHKIWQQIKEKEKTSQSGNLIYQGLTLCLKSLRDLADETTEKVLVDNQLVAKEMNEFAKNFFPENKIAIEYYSSDRPIFDLYSIEDEINKALKRRVVLKSGGYLVIDQTEAMTTIDVNTGKFVGSSNHEETIFKTNLEAANAIARQLRLRNLGGIIIIDFIDMVDDRHQKMLMESFVTAMDNTYSKYAIESLSGIGLVQMTRKRTRESLGHILCENCPLCQGRGYVKSVETIAFEIIRELMREFNQFKPLKMMIICSQELADYLSDEEPDVLADIEDNISIPIVVRADTHYSREQYDIALY